MNDLNIFFFGFSITTLISFLDVSKIFLEEDWSKFAFLKSSHDC